MICTRWQTSSKPNIKRKSAKTSRMIRQISWFMPSKLFFVPGTTQELMFTVWTMIFHIHGELLSMYRWWLSATWERHPVQVLPLPVTRQPVRIVLWVNSFWMPRVKMLWPVSVHHRRFLICRRLCRMFMTSLLVSAINLKTITEICRIWNLLLKTVISICCRLVTANVPLRLHLRLPVI